MSDKPQVVKLAQPGIDVKTAGDEHLVYNSNWPLLKIYAQGSFTTRDVNSSSQLVINHGLGYTPAFWYFGNNAISDYDGFGGALEERSDFNMPTIGVPTVNSKSLVFDIPVPPSIQPVTKFYYYIFALDISKPYQAPQIKSGGVIGPRNTKTVFKLAKPGKDISSNSLEDYVINSDARSPMVHGVYPGTVQADASVPLQGKGFTVYHNLGYIPMFFAYVSDLTAFPNDYFLLPAEGDAESGFIVDEQKITAGSVLAVGTKITLAILKDPFSIDYTVSVTI